MHLSDSHSDLVVGEVARLLVDAVDGLRTADDVLAAASAEATLRGHSTTDVEDAWRWLLRRGLLVDADEHLRRVSAVPTDPLPTRQMPSAIALLDLLTTPDGDRRWRARRSCAVRVDGRGPTADHVRRLLAASGVPVVDEGREARPDLVVLGHDREAPVDTLESLMRTDTPHLLGGLRDHEGRVGPLVVPGWTACSRCFDLYQVARDPSWRWRRALLSAPATHPLGTITAPPTVQVITGALLAAEVVTFVEAGEPTTCNGTVRVRADEPCPTVEKLEPHPWCGCIWPSGDTADPAGNAAGHAGGHRSGTDLAAEAT